MWNMGLLGAAGFTSDYELISSTVLGTATSSVSFSSLGDFASTYKHLQIRMTGRSDRAGTQFEYGKMTFNSNTSSIYTTHQLYGDGGSVLSFAGTSQSFTNFVRFAGSLAPTNAFGAAVVDILDFSSTTKNKTIRNLGGVVVSGGGEILLASGLSASTDAITSIGLAPGGGTVFLTGSRFSLYGIKG